MPEAPSRGPRQPPVSPPGPAAEIRRPGEGEPCPAPEKQTPFAQEPFPWTQASVTIPIACTPAVQSNRFCPAGLALPLLPSLAYGPQEKSLLMRRIGKNNDARDTMRRV
jgi:hypothetical protein